MNCYFHPGEPAVATCDECGKALCHSCATQWEPPLCPTCAKQRIEERKAANFNTVRLGLVIFIIGCIYGIVSCFQHLTGGYGNPFLELVKGIWYGYCLAGIPSGWRSLTRITPRIFLILPIIGWVFYFIIKFFLSYFVGLVMFPVTIYRYFSEKKKTDALSDRADR